jgi:hypothetical protein
MTTPCQHPLKSHFEFDLSIKAVNKNFILLNEIFGGGLQRALKTQQGSPLTYGSEFNPFLTLELIFIQHPSWPKMKSVLSNGSTWPLRLLDKINQTKDVENPLVFRNHKGAEEQQDLLQILVKDDANRGFALPLPLYKIKLVPGILLAPLNIQLQKTINECGESIPKTDSSMTRAGNGNQEHLSTAELTKTS